MHDNAGFIPCRVFPKKMIVIAALLGAQDWGVSMTTDLLMSARINGPVVLVTYPGKSMI